MDMAVEKRAVVEVGFDPVTMTQARTRLVPIERPGEELPALPVPGDLWCALTVRARLERMGEVYRQLPHSPDTVMASRVRRDDAGKVIEVNEAFRSWMPEPVRELFKDEPGVPRRLLPSDRDIAAAHRIVDVLCKADRDVAWAIANRLSDRKLGKAMRCDGKTAAGRKQDVLHRLAVHWNTMEWRPDREDCARVEKFFHKKVGGVPK